MLLILQSRQNQLSAQDHASTPPRLKHYSSAAEKVKERYSFLLEYYWKTFLLETGDKNAHHVRISTESPDT